MGNHIASEIDDEIEVDIPVKELGRDNAPPISENRHKLKYEKRKAQLEQLEQLGLVGKFVEGMTGGGDDQRKERNIIKRITEGTIKYTPQEFEVQIERYFQKQDSEQKLHITPSGAIVPLLKQHPYTVEGLCVYLGIGVKEFKKYESHPAYKEYHSIADFALTRISDKLQKGALMRELDPSMAKFILKNRTDMTEDGDQSDKKRQKFGKITFVTVNNVEEARQIKQVVDGAVMKDIEVIPEDVDE